MAHRQPGQADEFHKSSLNFYTERSQSDRYHIELRFYTSKGHNVISKEERTQLQKTITIIRMIRSRKVPDRGNGSKLVPETVSMFSFSSVKPPSLFAQDLNNRQLLVLPVAIF